MDAYIRVSRVGGRDGEAYHAPEIQRSGIERWAKYQGVELGKVVQEEDVSGARPIAQRGLEGLIKRAEAGVSAGVIVHRVDRFGRDQIETSIAVKRLRDANARLVGVADRVDSDQPQAKMLINFLATQAEIHLDRIRENWNDVSTRAVGRGVHIAARAPLGYVRADQADPVHDVRGRPVRDGRLVVDPTAGPVIRRAFEMRAEGASYREIVKHIEESLDRGVAKSTVAGMFQNRAYLGEARGPGKGNVKKGAHEALVTEELFSRVRPRSGTLPPRAGTLASQARLGGLITCASCGHKLRIMGATNPRTGERRASYSNGVIREEEDFTSAMLSATRIALKQVEIGGVGWDAAVLRKQTEEPELGADLLGVLEVSLPTYRVSKGFLAQAKLVGERKHVKRPKLRAQCRDMLDLTPASYVFLYDVDAVRVVPAIAVLANGGEPRDLHAWSIMEFFFEHFACFAGDERLGQPLSETLAAMDDDLDRWRREFRAANLLAMSAVQRSKD